MHMVLPPSMNITLHPPLSQINNTPHMATFEIQAGLYKLGRLISVDHHIISVATPNPPLKRDWSIGNY